MRHDPASAAVVVMLRGLKMYGMAQAAGDLIEQGAPAFDAAVPILSQLLKAEMSEREVRRSEEHTSELQSLMRISYAVFCLKKKNKDDNTPKTNLQLYPTT